MEPGISSSPFLLAGLEAAEVHLFKDTAPSNGRKDPALFRSQQSASLLAPQPRRKIGSLLSLPGNASHTKMCTPVRTCHLLGFGDIDQYL